MSLLAPAFKQIRLHARAYLLINTVFYGLVVLGAVYAFLQPQVQRQLIQTIVEGFGAPPLSFARAAYTSGDVASAALITFLVNSFLGSLLALTLPSLFVPFFGTFMGFYRALLWGVALAPTSPELARAMIPHSLTLVLEGQGYILAMLGIHILWTSTFDGLRQGIPGAVSGYRAGLRTNVTTYRLVLLVLAVSAIYEAFEVIYLVRG